MTPGAFAFYALFALSSVFVFIPAIGAGLVELLGVG